MIARSTPKNFSNLLFQGKLAVAEHCLIEGADEYLQIMAIATHIMKTLATVA